MITAKLTVFTSRFENTYNLEFIGKREFTSDLNQWSIIISLADYEVQQSLNHIYYNKQDEINKIINCVNSEIKQLKQQHKLPVVFYKENYKKVKQLEQYIKKLENANLQMLSKIESPSNYSASNKNKRLAYENFLNENDFTLKNCSTGSYKEIQIFEFNGNEQDLLIKVKDEINRLRNAKKIKTEAVITKANAFLKESGINELIDLYNQKENKAEIEKE